MSTSGSLRAPLLWLLLPFMAGIASADALGLTASKVPLLAVGAVVSGLAAIVAAQGKHPALRWIWVGAFCGAVALCGCAAFALRTPAMAAWNRVPREVTVTLEIDQVFPISPKRKTVSGLGRIVAADEHATEAIGQRVYFSAIRKVSVPPARSGRYVVRGILATREPASDALRGFDRYLDSLGLRLTLTRAQFAREETPPRWFQRFCADAEDRLEAILRRGLDRHPETASLYLAMLLGEKAVLSAEQENAFMRSGTFHIFSISGLHVGVIAVTLQALLQLLRMPRRGATLAGLTVLWAYVEITGGSTPAVRAFLMIAFVRSAQVFRLPGNSLAALATAAFVTLLLDPQQLFSTGFQMSYAVVTALIVMAAPLSDRWLADWKPWRDRPEADWRWPQHVTAWLGRKCISAWAATWVALLASVPSSIGYFGYFSPGALVANLVVIPLSSLALVAGVASLVSGLFGAWPLSFLFNRAAALVIKTMDWLVLHGTELPGMYFRAQFRTPWLASAAIVFVLAVMLLGASRRWPRKEWAFWWPVAAVVLVVFLGVKFG